VDLRDVVCKSAKGFLSATHGHVEYVYGPPTSPGITAKRLRQPCARLLGAQHANLLAHKVNIKFHIKSKRLWAS
jgi:hypothetical protein